MTDETTDAPPTGRIVGGEHRLPLRVYYEDTDAGGVVYHASYLRFFERARTEMLGLVGADHVAALAVEGAGYVVAELAIRYRVPGRLGDALVVISSLAEVRRSAVVVQQRVMRDTQLVADGRVVVVFVGPDGRPRRQPEAWITAFAAITTGAPAPA